MPKTRGYPPEIRERAVRLVFEHEHEYPSQWSNPVDRREVRPQQGDPSPVGRPGRARHRTRPGLSTDEREGLRNLKREVKELRRANESLAQE